MRVLEPDTGRVITQTRWRHNTISAWLTWMVWSLMAINIGDQGSDGIENTDYRFYDGTYYYPNWYDLFQQGLLESTTSSTTAGDPWEEALVGLGLGNALMGVFMVGDYSGSALSGNTSVIDGTWTVYGTAANSLYTPSIPGWSANSSPLVFGNQVYGVGFNSRGWTVASDNSATTVDITFASNPESAGSTVNAMAFVPSNIHFTASDTVNPATALYPADGFEASTTNPSGAFAALSITGAQGTTITNPLTCSTLFLASSPVSVPSGANLQISYEIASSVVPG